MKPKCVADPIDWTQILTLALLLAGLFYSTGVWLVTIDWPREDYNYCYLVPFIVLYLIWEKKEELSKKPAVPSWAGLFSLVLGILLFWIGELAGELYSLYLSSWLVSVGILWMHIGWPKLKIIGFASFMALAMFPLPVFVNTKLTSGLKLISSQLGVALIHLYGLTVYREGNIIDLGFTQLQVVDACSGLRYLFPLLIMGILIAYFYGGKFWKKVILVVSTVPLTIITNSLRIAATGVLYEIWGPAVAEDFFHGFSGWFIFMFGLAVLLLEMWVLNGFRGLGIFGGRDKEVERVEIVGMVKGAEDQTGSSGSPIQAELPNLSEPANPQNYLNPPNPPNSPNLLPAPKGLKAFFHPPQFVVAVLLLAGTLALAQGVEFREKIPPAKDFASFPLELGDWTGRREIMEEKFLKELDLNDYVIVDYMNGSKAVNFYTAYYESQRKGESIHSPETCLPGGGWEFRNAGAVTLPLKARNGEPMRVNRAFMEKGAYKQLSYFWFPSRDRVLTNAWEMKWYNFWDALTRQRTDGALVRLITPVYAGEEAADADKRLVAFTKEIVPVLNEFLPK